MKEIELLFRIARGVREGIIERYPHGGGNAIVGTGPDGSPTFEIDAVAEDIARKILDENAPEMNVLSEETGLLDRGSDSTLIIDPIDGSHNAVNGIPLFCVSLAISKGAVEKVRHAVVADIVRGTTYHASLGSGAFRDGVRIHTREMVLEEATFSSYLSRFNMEANGGLLSLPKKGRYLGCVSLEMCLVAQGSLDLFAMLSRPPRMIDIAAGTLILKEAGGNTYWSQNDGKWGEYILTNEADDIDDLLSLGDPSFAPRIFDLYRHRMDTEVGQG